MRSLHSFVARPAILSLLITINIAAYFGGLLYWYGGYIAEISPPIWTWAFIPDCPLFGLLGGLALLLVTAHTYWSKDAQLRARRALIGAGIVFGILWLSTYLPAASTGWAVQRAMLALCSWSLLLFGLSFGLSFGAQGAFPRWLLLITALGSIKYGIWTVTAWALFWKNTALYMGAPMLTPESLFMTLTHIGMIVQGLFLLTYFTPSRSAVLAAFVWLGLSDVVDYALGYHPPVYVPDQLIPLATLQWSTISVTVLLCGWALWQSRRFTPGADGTLLTKGSTREDVLLLKESA